MRFLTILTEDCLPFRKMTTTDIYRHIHRNVYRSICRIYQLPYIYPFKLLIRIGIVLHKNPKKSIVLHKS